MSEEYMVYARFGDMCALFDSMARATLSDDEVHAPSTVLTVARACVGNFYVTAEATGTEWSALAVKSLHDETIVMELLLAKGRFDALLQMFDDACADSDGCGALRELVAMACAYNSSVLLVYVIGRATLEQCIEVVHNRCLARAVDICGSGVRVPGLCLATAAEWARDGEYYMEQCGGACAWAVRGWVAVDVLEMLLVMAPDTSRDILCAVEKIARLVSSEWTPRHVNRGQSMRAVVALVKFVQHVRTTLSNYVAESIAAGADVEPWLAYITDVNTMLQDAYITATSAQAAKLDPRVQPYFVQSFVQTYECDADDGSCTHAHCALHTVQVVSAAPPAIATTYPLLAPLIPDVPLTPALAALVV